MGDTVNLSQRLQQWAEPGETVLSEPTVAGPRRGGDRHGSRARHREGPGYAGAGVQDLGNGELVTSRPLTFDVRPAWPGNAKEEQT